ncbi:MAG: hypothetical protein ACR2RA_13345 [Geminicoccaceae bacterium]
MKHRVRSRGDLWWLVSGIVLAGVVTIQSIEPLGSFLRSAEAVPLTSVRSAGDLPVVISLDAAIAGPKVEFVSAIAYRPLFMKSRGAGLAQSSTPATGQEIERSKEPPSIELIGTLLSARADVALVAEGPDQSRRLRVGDTVSDWKIVRIQRDNLTLMQNDRVAPISLR